jgi:probable biosynthetic protein (TIGR04098 family)
MDGIGLPGFAAQIVRRSPHTSSTLPPHEDFNGADFLYFAAFQAMLDRAEWHWFHHSDPLLVTTGRQIFYTGNIELGDQVRTTLCGIVKKGGNLSSLDRNCAKQRR